MARSRLLRSLSSVVKNHKLARESGVPIQAIHEGDFVRRFGQHFNRRDFMRGAAIATGGLIIPRFASASTQPRIAVIGAGIAGLAAALRLKDNGLNATIYESSGRAGGRMYTNRTFFNEGQHFEWCGELVDSGHATIQRLAKRFGLVFDDLTRSEVKAAEETYYFDGSYYPYTEANRDFKALEAVLRDDLNKAGAYTTVFESTAHGRMLDHMSVYDWIALRVQGGHSSRLGQLLNTAYQIELNSDTRVQSALNLIYLLGYQKNWGKLSTFGVSDERYKIRGGNQSLPDAIANSLSSGQVELGMRLEAVAKRAAGDYSLTFDSPSGVREVLADYVIIALPFAVLRHIDTSRAGFDDQKSYAINNLGAGRQSKQHLQFTRRVWTERGGMMPEPGTGGSYSDTGYQSSWEASRGQAGTSGILVGYAGGDAADEMASTTAFSTSVESSDVVTDATRFLGQINPVFPGIAALWNGKSTQGLPHLDPNFKCSYSYFKIGQYQTIAGYERVTQGNIYFAGEHCSFDFQGFMEGGAIEGERAAADVLTSLGKIPVKVKT